MNKAVLDASALLAVLFCELGADAVMSVLPNAAMSAINISEVIARMLERGVPLERAVKIVTEQKLDIIPFDAEQATLAASFRPATRHLGLSLGDRACFALGFAKRLPVLTADRLWAKAEVGVLVEIIR